MSKSSQSIKVLTTTFGYLSPVKYAEQYYQSRPKEPTLYPQTANENPSKIEGRRLVDKILEKL